MKVFAKDVMQKDVKTVRQDLAMADLERRFIADNVSAFPVVDSDQSVQGIVTARDVLAHVCELRSEVEMSTSFYDEEGHADFTSLLDDWVSAEVGKRADHLCVRDLMTEDVISVPSSMSLHEVAALLTEKKIHRVLVIDDRRLVGIVSTSDIVRACGNDLIDISFKPPEILDF